MLRSLAAYVGWSLLILLFLGVVAGQVLGQPAFLLVVETDSMEPTLEPGDAAVVVPDFATERTYGEGDIVVFDDETLAENRPTTHRIVGERPAGFVTQGDNNPVTDQADQEPPVSRDRILGYVPTRGQDPLVLPGVGPAVLYVQGLAGDDPRRLVGLGAVIAVLGVLSSVFDSRRYERASGNSDRLDPVALVPVFVVLLVVLATAAMVLPAGPEGVGIEATDGEPQSDGVYQTGTTATITYEFDNAGYIPLYVVLESESDVVVDSSDRFLAGPRGTTDRELRVAVPEEPGLYETTLSEYRYLLVLPPSVIARLHAIHPLAALAAVDAVVALLTAGTTLLFVGTKPVPSRSQAHNAPRSVRLRRWLRAVFGRE